MTAPIETRLKPPVEVPLAELRQHPGNPRRISKVRLEHLQRTLKAERSMLAARPLIAWPDGTVIAGNQRLAAAIALGWETIPVVYADLDDEQAARWMLLDNRGFGEDDPELLAAMLRDLDARGADPDLAGYLPADVDAVLRAAQPVSSRDPDEVPSSPTVPASERGTVYELGPHRVMCGDATDPGDVAALVGSGTLASVVTDPPYGIEREGITNDDPRTLRALFDGMLAATPLRDAVVAAFQSPRLVVEWLDAVRAAGHQFERLLWLHRQAAKTYPWRGWVLASDAIALSSLGSPAWPEPADFSHDTYVKTELEDPALTGKHTTIKPSWIVADLIAKLPSGDVYDPFAGSGTTLIAAEQLGRRCLAMEIDPAYVDVIRQRYADYTDQPQYAP